VVSLTVSRLAAQAGITPDTVRYYERAGVLSPKARSASGYRLYEQSHLDRLRFVKGAQRLGLRLREIRELLDVRDRGLCPCGHTEALLRRQITGVDAELLRLEQLRNELSRMADRSRAGCPDGEMAWPCERDFIRLGGGEPQ
jgi:DNA-binding transcriptional MerR regulator